jgi:hypothetical protein
MYTTGRSASGGVYSLPTFAVAASASRMASAKGVIMTSEYEKTPYFIVGLNSKLLRQMPLQDNNTTP